MNYEVFKKQAGWIPGIPAFGGTSVRYRIDDPATGKSQYVDYNTYKQHTAQQQQNGQIPNAYQQQEMTAQDKYNTFQNRMKDTVMEQQGGLFHTVAKFNNDFFDRYGVGLTGFVNPGALFASGDHDVISRPWRMLKVFNPAEWSNGGQDIANDTNSDTYKLRQKALASDAAKQEVQNFSNSLSMQDIQDLQKTNPSLGKNENDSPAMAKLKEYGTQQLQTRVWDLVKENPLQNLPAAIGLFLRQKGWDSAGDFFSNPIAFYGSLLGLFGGAALLFGGSKGESSNVNNYYNRVPYS